MLNGGEQMLDKIALIFTAVGYFLLLFTENMVAFPIFLIIAAGIISLIDLIPLYKSEKLDFGDFVKEACITNWGSVISVIGVIFFIFLCIIYG